LDKEDQVTSDTLQEATLKASELLKRHLSAFDRTWRNLPSPRLYEEVVPEKGETVQLLIASRDLPEEKRRGFLFGIALCCIPLFLLLIFVTLSPSGCASASPEAANIISELRNLKAAAMMYRKDHPDALSSLSENENHITLLLPYFDNPEKYSEKHGSYVYRIENGAGWAGYNVSDRTSGLREKLEGKAQSTGLFGSLSVDEPPASCDITHIYKKDAKAVWLLIRH
jgi:hypothetical protein